jgi:hypothetical protein
MTIDTSKSAPATSARTGAGTVGGLALAPARRQGDRLALTAPGRVVPIYQTNSPEGCEYILAHAAMATTPRACAGRTSRAA